MDTKATANWRLMTAGDVQRVKLVSDMVHAPLLESEEVLAERARLFPEGCLVLVVGGEICGYTISHPVRRGLPPDLDSLLGGIAADADQYYIHDLAILPSARGRGLATVAINRMLDVAARYPSTSLVSIHGTAKFWGRFGFEKDSETQEQLADKLRTYGDDAVYMSRHNK